MRKIIIFAIVLVIATVAALRIYQHIQNSSGSKSAEFQERIVTVKTAVVNRRDVKKILNLTGDIHGKIEINVFPKVTGKLLKKVRREGQGVKKDAVIALIDRDEPGMKFVTAEVKSPIEGILFSYYSDIGDFVGYQAPLLKMGVIDKVKVVAYLSEGEIAGIKEGLKARVKVDAYSDSEFQGKISSVSPVIDPLTRKLKIEIEIPNEGHLLRPGMFARVQIVVDTYHNAVVIPLEAIVDKGEEKSVFLVKDGRAYEVRLELGMREGNDYEVISGLTGGEEIVVQGSYGLKEGMRVKIAKNSE